MPIECAPERSCSGLRPTLRGLDTASVSPLNHDQDTLLEANECNIPEWDYLCQTLPKSGDIFPIGNILLHIAVFYANVTER